MHTEVDILSCPTCGAEVGHTIRHNGFKAAATSIGPPLLRCTSCDTLVRSGQKEWEQQNAASKAWFFISRTAWLIAGSFFVCGGIAGVLNLIAVDRKWIDDANSTTFILSTDGFCTLLLSAIVLRNSLAEIRASLKRSQSDEARNMWREANPLPTATEFVTDAND